LLNDYWDRRFAPELGERYSWSDGKSKAVSFHTLVEFYTFFQFREAGGATKEILKAHQELSDIFKTPFPFATSKILDGLNAAGKKIVFQFNEDHIINLDMRINSNSTEEAIALIQKTWKKLNPEREIIYNFLDEDFEDLYATEHSTGKIITYLTILAIIISCLGLFGLASYSAEQRTKEIGIRKVFGASKLNLFLLVSRDFTMLVILAFVISTPMAWLWMKNWLSGFAYRIDIQINVFILSGLLAYVIAIATVSYQSLKAARANPINSLRNE